MPASAAKMAFALSAANKGAMRKHDIDEDVLNVSLHSVVAETVWICCINFLFPWPTRFALFLSPQDHTTVDSKPQKSQIKKAPLKLSPSMRKPPEVCTFYLFPLTAEVEIHVLPGWDTPSFLS